MNKNNKCYNCIHSSKGFKIGNKTHIQCLHPINYDAMKLGEITPWDTLEEWYSTCELHELKQPKEITNE